MNEFPFSLRMAEHLLVQLVIPPLVLLSLPAKTPLWPPFCRIVKHPFLTWFLGLGAMWAWHSPALCNAAVRSPLLEAFQLFTLLVLGAAFWWPIAGPQPALRLSPLLGIVYLFTACLGCTILGIIITFAPAGIYVAAKLPGALNEWQFANPADQRVGGLLMWVPGCLIYICGIMGLMARWYAPPTGNPERIS